MFKRDSFGVSHQTAEQPRKGVAVSLQRLIFHSSIILEPYRIRIFSKSIEKPREVKNPPGLLLILYSIPL